MAEYRLLTIWCIEAPLEDVYAAIHNALRWPDWWPGVQAVEQLAPGDANGVDSVLRYAWQGELPYRLEFEVCATRIEALVAIEGVARWHFSRQGPLSVVRYDWHVRSTRWWMNVLALLARSIFIRNHARLMAQGGEGLARLLDSPLIGQESIDLMATDVPLEFRHSRENGNPVVRRWIPGRSPRSAESRGRNDEFQNAWPAVLGKNGGEGRQRGRIDPLLAVLAGLSAGVLATVAQLMVWWLNDVPLAETLLRDARLTAALLMGTEVLPPSTRDPLGILLLASAIHFALSIFYALLPAQLCGRWRTVPTLLAGALYGLAIYGVNLYGFTLLFPWFAVSRDAPTLIAHLVFGIALAGVCQLRSERV